jgi:hypothetical protein
LFGIRVNPALVSRPHERILTEEPVMDKLTREGWERRFLPGLKARVSTPRS